MQITTADSTAVLFSASDGNLYLKPLLDSADPSDTSVFFYGDQSTGIVMTDYAQRFISIYQSTMATYGVSRIRLHNITHVPVSSRMVYVIFSSFSPPFPLF